MGYSLSCGKSNSTIEGYAVGCGLSDGQIIGAHIVYPDAGNVTNAVSTTSLASDLAEPVEAAESSANNSVISADQDAAVYENAEQKETEDDGATLQESAGRSAEESTENPAEAQIKEPEKSQEVSTEEQSQVSEREGSSGELDVTVSDSVINGLDNVSVNEE